MASFILALLKLIAIILQHGDIKYSRIA